MAIGAWIRSWLRNLFRRPQVERQLDDELRAYLEMVIDEKVAAGIPYAKARRDALVEIGGVTQVKQAVREGRTGMGLETVMQDARYALRTLAKDRGFTTIVVLVLALGIGANVAVFSVVNTLLLRPLPFADAGRLVWFSGGLKLDAKLREAVGLSATTYAVPAYEEFRRHNNSFASVTAYNPFLANSEYTLTESGEPQGVSGVMVAGNFFQTLGVQPALGRLFVNEELHKGGRPAVLLSDGFWRRQFHRDPAIVGKAITLNKQPYTVVGVMPADFDFGAVFSPGMKFDVYTPAVMDAMRDWGNTLAIVGRLKPGVSLAQAQAEADTLFPELTREHPDWGFDYSSKLTGLKEFVSGELRRSLIVLWSAVGMVLLIVCVNLSNMLMARALSRSKEFAMRAALGAGRGRLIRQLLTEGLILAAAGGSLGLGLAYSLIYYLAHQESIAVPLLSGVHVDREALLWTLGMTLLTTVLFGLGPGLKVTGANLQAALKDGGHGMSAGGRHERLRSAMVIAEIAISCVLLIGAGLLLRSFWKTLQVDMGFDAGHAATIRIDYANGDGIKRGLALEEILRRVRAIPGITAAGEADMLPLGTNRSWQFSAQEHPPREGEIDAAMVRIVTPGYLGAMGMRLVGGRDFGWQDVGLRKDSKTGVTTGSPNVVIVNQAAARHFWPGEDAMGKIAVVDGGDGGNARVIGVIVDVRETSLEAAAGPEVYLPVMQADPEGAELVVRSSLPASTLSPSVLAVLRSVNPGQPAYELRPLGEIVDHAVSPRKFFLVLVMSFAGLGLVLASLGIYGVIAYSVAQRTSEIGIRMALGASARKVQMSVMGKTMRLALVGIAAGAAASFAMASGIGAMLYGTAPTDPLTYAGMVLLLCAVAVLAGYVPARRASRISPMVALRR